MNIGKQFADCGNISLFIIGPNIERICSDAWENCVIDSLVFATTDKYLYIKSVNLKGDEYHFENVSLKGVYLGRKFYSSPKHNGISYVADFNGSDIKYVTIGASITKLGDLKTIGYNYGNFFKDCKNLCNVIFEGESITIGWSCFTNTSIKNLNFPYDTKCGVDCFPENLNSISFEKIYIEEKNNLSECTSLKTITCRASDPKLCTIPNNSFSTQQYTTTKLLVPYGSKKAYQNAEPWKNFWNIEEMSAINTEKVEISPVNTNLHVGDSIRLTGTQYPKNATDTLQWKSSNINIATISNNGLLTAVAPGKTTITVISGKTSATSEITVRPITATKITLSKYNVEIYESDTIKITATVSPENTTDKTIKWSSSDEKIATVSTEGIIKAIKVGTVEITANCGDVSENCKVTVLPITAEKIVLSHDKVSINKSDTLRITATVTPETTTDKTIKWTSSDEKVVKVSSDGIISAIGEGTATITAACGEISSTCEVTVYEPNIAIEFTDNTLSVIVEGSGDSVHASVFTVFGQCIYRQSADASVVTKKEIDLSKLPSGTYIVQVVSGAMNASKRIVK